MKYRLHQKLEWAIEDALSKPPSATGRRLAPERVLCEITGVSRVSLRLAIDSLIARGLLVRRHGSGTYVRKVPAPPAIPAGAGGAFAVTAETLFAGLPETPTRLRMPAHRKSLRIVGWMNERSEYLRQMLVGMRRRCGQEGHDFVNLAVNPHNPRDITRLRRHRKRNHVDGYIIDSNLAAMFDAEFAEPRPPVVYVGHGEFDPDHEPIIQVDQHNAIQRALYKLRDTGYRRIGLIAMNEPLAERTQLASYPRCMKELGLKYRRTVSLPLRPAAHLDELRRMLMTKPRPQAVYVGDDILLRGLVKLLERLECRPGKELAVITLGSYGVPLPAGYDWSVMEFNPVQTGALAMESLVRGITRAGEPLCSVVHRAAWHPGTTHLRS
jgi:DNA-binding LacI/PurR family transcriptional regulator